ncbi:probable LRR receptor-like serine/threonine-protein kinase MEE39 [Aristolochia californica]|uniref:probable LRR receptor-like serine/threonine-protein kinase MEE39 n=1 Tax=Aristolochia californica TaxID=171875 RepID=UPI0035DBAD29
MRGSRRIIFFPRIGKFSIRTARTPSKDGHVFISHFIVAVFISLDCGAEPSYFDNNDIFWLPDDLYVTGGETRKAPGTTSRPMSTLRVFPTRKKNCYSIDVTKGERLLVRASFFYGNYDGKSLPPIFDLQIDENHFYVSMYFVEMSKLDTTEKRSLVVSINNEKRGEVAIVPPCQNAIEVVIDNLRGSANTSIALVAIPDSTLPPIISAIEIYAISNSGGTGFVAKNLYKLQEWNGDPCLPTNFTWDWVACNSDEVPRITALGLNLYGPLPDFSVLDALETIDMLNNSLNGGTPDFLGSLPNLKELNIAGKDFNGPIPSSITKNTKLRLK